MVWPREMLLRLCVCVCVFFFFFPGLLAHLGFQAVVDFCGSHWWLPGVFAGHANSWDLGADHGDAP